MSFTASNGRIAVSNSAGTVVFDTDRKMPAIVGVLTGALYLPTYSAEGHRYYYLGAASACELIFPTLQVTFSGGSPDSFRVPIIPFSAVGSTLTDSAWLYFADGGLDLIASRILTVVSDGTSIYLDENVWSLDEAGGPALTLTYKIYLGRFV